MSRIVKCPTCGKTVAWSDTAHWRPFCSERCKLIDLGAWANETHRIPGEPVSGAELDSERERQKD